jgi:isochorismate hydrolase
MAENHLKENYASEENLPSKTKEWLRELERYTKKKRFEFEPQLSALLVTDMQNFFLKEESHAFLPASKAIIPNIRALIEFYRNHNLPVIFTRHSLEKDEEPGIMGEWWADVIWEDDDLSKVVDSLKSLDSETIIRKTRYSAFIGTELDKLLKERKVKTVVITGVMTHLCCETTARDAFMRDYQVFFVIDGTATQNEELHISSLRTLSHGFAVPVTTSEIRNTFEENPD